MSPAERVILVKGGSTKWYNQAIFIVNKEIPATKMPVDFVAEAEKIIYTHLTKEKNRAAAKEAAVPGAYLPYMPQKISSAPAPAKQKKPASAFDFTLNIVMIMACVAIVAVFAYGMMS